MRFITIIVCILSLISLSSCLVKDSVSIYNKDSNVIIDNHLVKVSFNTETGIYTAYDKRDNLECISNATFSINNYCSTNSYTFHWEESDVKDELGIGKKLILKGEKENQLTLLFEITLYQDKSYLVLNMGIVNNTKNDLRIKDFYPLKGKAFQNFEFPNFQTVRRRM